MSSPKTQTQQVCRMSWFLIEVTADKTTTKGGVEYLIVHSVDINEKLSVNMYVDGVVKFDHNRRMIEGKILLAAEDRSYIEREIQRLTSPTEINKRKEQYFFVQYSNENNDLVHAVLPKSELQWSAGVPLNSAEVSIKIDGNDYPVTVLSIAEDQKQLEHEFQSLKKWCLNKCPKENNSIVTPASWILVQYSKTPLETVYTIINEGDTEWNEQNPFKSVAVFLKIGETIYQAVVMLRSQELHSLIVLRNEIKECAALSSLLKPESSICAPREKLR